MGVRLAQAKTGPLHCIGKFTASPMISFQRESSFGNLVVFMILLTVESIHSVAFLKKKYWAMLHWVLCYYQESFCHA